MSGRVKGRLRILACVGLTTLAGGCYSYVPARLETLDPGSSVRMEISAVAADRLESMRFSVAPRVEGIIVQRDESDLEIDALIRTVDAYGITAVHTQRLSMSLDDVRSVSYRRLDRAKTGLAVGALGVALGAAVYILFRGDLGSIDDFETPVDFQRSFQPFPRGSPR